MGIYVFTARPMYELLFQDAARPDSGHDFGKDIIPRMLGTQRRLRLPVPRQEPQGRLVLARRRHARRLLPGQHGPDRRRPGPEPLRPRLADPHLPAAAAAAEVRLHDERPAGQARRGEALDSIVCQGCIVSGGQVVSSILSPGVRVNSYALVEDSILFDGVEVGRHCRIRRAIIDKDVKIPPHTTIGHDLDHDRQRGFLVTEQGIVVIAKGETFDAPAVKS